MQRQLASVQAALHTAQRDLKEAVAGRDAAVTERDQAAVAAQQQADELEEALQVNNDRC